MQVIANLDKVGTEGECADSNISNSLKEFKRSKKVEEEELLEKET